MRHNENWDDRDDRGREFERGGVRQRDFRDPPRDDPDAIEADIRRTRVEMDETLDELIRRLEPARLLGDVWHSVRNRAGSAGDGAASMAGRVASVAGSRVARQVSRHPLPSAVIGAGLAWLLTEQLRGGSSRDRDRDRDWEDWDSDAWSRYRGGPMSQAQARSDERLRGYTGYNPYDDYGHERHRGGPMHNIGRRAAGTARSAAHGVGDAAERAGHSVAGAGRRAVTAAEHAAERGIHAVSGAAREVGDRASTGMHVASRRISRTANHAADNIAHTASDTYERYPLGVALAAMGAGLLAGMAVPNTRRENRWMGETSRRLRRDAIGTAREQAAEAIETGSERLAHAAESAAERAERAVRGSDDTNSRGESSDGGPEKAGQADPKAGQKTGQTSSQRGSQVEPRH